MNNLYGNNDGSNGASKPSSYSAMRPTLHLKAGVTITGGSGTMDDPYTLTLVANNS